MNKKPNLSAFLSLLLLSMLLLTLLTTPALADASWDIQTVDENGDGHGVSMALDSKDHPHLCYTAYVDGYYRNPLYLTYASWNGNAWNTQVVDSITETQDAGFLIFDSNNNPHISYTKGEKYGDEFLMYAEWTGFAWSIQTVDSSSIINLGYLASMALDSSGNPRIGYYGGYHGQYYIASVLYAKLESQLLSASQLIVIIVVVVIILTGLLLYFKKRKR